MPAAMKVAMVAAEFTDKDANGLRKAMGTFRGDGTLHERVMAIQTRLRRSRRLTRGGAQNLVLR